MNISAKEYVKKTIALEIEGLKRLLDSCDGELVNVIDQTITKISQIQGRVIVTGLGKSGHVASKIAATLASTGTPAFYIHPTEANHGDLGMVARDDVVMALSWSGESSELSGILAYCTRFKIPLIAITSDAKSTLAKSSDIVINLPTVEEACPHGLAPTTSSILQMAIGDAFSVSLLQGRGFSKEEFSIYHPGGSLGARLKRVDEIMHSKNNIPIVKLGSLMREAVLIMSEKGFGCVIVIDDKEQLVGIITDGDLRRHIDQNLLEMKVEDVMTKNPKTINQDKLASSALEVMNSINISILPVMKDKQLLGLIHMHDLVRAGIV